MGGGGGGREGGGRGEDKYIRHLLIEHCCICNINVAVLYSTVSNTVHRTSTCVQFSIIHVSTSEEDGHASRDSLSKQLFWNLLEPLRIGPEEVGR